MAEKQTTADGASHHSMATPTTRRGPGTNPWPGRAWAVLVAIFLLVPDAVGAADSGQLLGLVRDPAGAALADVRLVLTGSHGERAVASDKNGRFRVDDLPPGIYILRIEEEGFFPVVYKPVHVRIGRATTLRIQLAASLDQTVVVTSEPPRVAARPDPPSPPVELDRIPADEDPFAAAAGISLAPAARAQSLGGHGSPAHGIRPEDDRQLDPTEDPSRALRSFVAADFDPGPGRATAAVSDGQLWQSRGGGELDLVTRKYTRLQVEVSAADGRPAASRPGGDTLDPELSQLVARRELGAQASGQLISERLFAWGSHRAQDASQRSVGGLEETLGLTSDAAELSALLGPVSLQLGYFRSEIRRTGVGAGPDRSLESTLESDQPSEVWKIEGRQVVGPSLEIGVRAASWASGRYQVPQAWRDPSTADPLILGPEGVWLGTFGDFSYRGEHQLWQLEVNRALGQNKARHEVHLGLAGQSSDSASAERWGSDGTVHLAGESLGLPFDLVRIVRPLAQQVERESVAFWIGDSLRLGRVTLDFSLRHDQQTGRNAAGSVAAHPLFPELLPGFEHSGGGAGFDWNTTLPRLSAAWTLDRQGRTVVRSGFGVYASRLDDDLVGRVSPAAPAELVLAYTDGDEDRFFDRGEPFLLLASYGIDPIGSGSARSAHQNPLSLEAEETEEWSLGIEHAPDTAWTFNLDLRQQNTPSAHELRPLVRQADGLVRVARSSDYILDQVLAGQLADGSTYLAPVYALGPEVEATGGNLLLNGDRRRRSRQISLTAQRRLVGGWQLRALVLVQSQEWQLGDDFTKIDDPTDLAPGSSADAGISLADGQGDPAGGALDGRVSDSRWAFELFAHRRIAPRRPWGLDASFVLRGREGTSIPYQATVLGRDGLVRQVQLTPDSDTYRLDDVVTADLRLEKDWTLGRILGGSQLVLGFDLFNLFDQRTVLEQESRLTSAQAAMTRATLHPRTFRLGVRWSW